MSNEHPEDIAELGVDESNGDVHEADREGADGIEEGPLDPSVFFGLFDDLDESTTEPTEQPDKPAPPTDPTPELQQPVDDGISHTKSSHPESVETDSGKPHDKSEVDAGTIAPDGSEVSIPSDDVETARIPGGPSSNEPESRAAQIFGDGPGGNNGGATSGGVVVESDNAEKSPAQPLPQIQAPPDAPSPTPSLYFAPVKPHGTTQTTPEPMIVGGQPQQAPHINATAATTTPQAVPTDIGRHNGSHSAAARPPAAAPPVLPFPAEKKPPLITVPVQTERAGGRLAAAALITIAVGLFGGLIVAFVLSLRSPNPAPGLDEVAGASEDGVPASSTVVEELSLTTVASGLGEGTVSLESLNDLVATETAGRLRESRLDMTGLVFQHGTTALDGPSQAKVEQLGAALAKIGNVPMTATVRTYSERTAAENLVLSRQQAQALVEALVAAGATPEQVRAVGLGSGPLSKAQPVPDFVEVTPGFGDGSISELIQATPPFAIGSSATGSSPSSWPFRLEGLIPLAEIGRGLQLGDDTDVGLAGYSFLASSDGGNRALAKATTERVAQILATDFGVDRDRISIITPGSAPYVPSADTGNLIWIAAGPDTRPTFDLAGIDVDAISFTGSVVSPDSQPSLDALGAILTESKTVVVIDVRSYDGGDSADNLSLSQGRADAFQAALEATGVTPGQVRTVASGASSYFSADGPLVTVTVVP